MTTSRIVGHVDSDYILSRIVIVQIDSKALRSFHRIIRENIGYPNIYIVDPFI